MKIQSGSSKKLFTNEEVRFFKQFKSPHDIQLFLDETKYNSEYAANSPRYVIRNGTANCFEGALFGAASLRMIGYKSLIVDMTAVNDDDHVIAIYKRNNLFGAVAKSNTTLLRFREPVYRSLRELVMSYFDFYFNTAGQKSLRSYSNPIDLLMFDKYNWMTTDEDLGYIGDYLYKVHHHIIVDNKSIRSLVYADKYLRDICFTGSVEEGLFKPVYKNKNRI